ncbi:secretory phospholipase A2 receptor-like [Parambassis ranga]|uniref:Secretory phospholipase A2 receptor-like n=1 Tax=Parambassis ranga TaxID=210632 RepID=A0A6P7IXB7_9TELE|nr:secretory phospholipase A2 receptor-like [Parambassis ranga]
MMKDICVFVPLLVLFSPVVQLLNFTRYAQDKTWDQAQAFCREKHTDLVTIRNEEENQQINGIYGWIGLYRENNTSPWKWSRGDEVATYINWNENEPQNNEHCVFNWQRSKWINDVCRARPFICYDEALLLVKENKTWEEALHHCRSLEGVNPDDPMTVYQNHLYDLATLTTANDHARAQKQAQQATTDEVWTGLRYLAGQWVWVGGEQVNYQDIEVCPTNNLCGVMKKNSSNLFGTRDCKEKRNFFCYRGIPALR